MTQLEKTMTHDVGYRSGANVLRQTLEKTPLSKGLDAAISADLRQLLNDCEIAGAEAKQQIRVSRLLGYCDEIAAILGGLHAMGMRIEAVENLNGHRTVNVKFGGHITKALSQART